MLLNFVPYRLDLNKLLLVIVPSHQIIHSASSTAIKCKCLYFQAKYDSDDEEVDLDDDASLKKDSKVIKFNTTSLRTDLILKSALGIARK